MCSLVHLPNVLSQTVNDAQNSSVTLLDSVCVCIHLEIGVTVQKALFPSPPLRQRSFMQDANKTLYMCLALAPGCCSISRCPLPLAPTLLLSLLQRAINDHDCYSMLLPNCIQLQYFQEIDQMLFLMLLLLPCFSAETAEKAMKITET